LDIHEIIKGCKSNERRSQDALVRRFAPGLLSVCLRYSKDKTMANDALQETFINIFKYLHTFEGKGSFEGWIRRIAVTNCIMINKKYHSFPVMELDFKDESEYAEIPDVFSKMNVDELMKVISKLPENQYLIFNMYVIEGMKHQEIAQLVGIAESSSRALLCRARMSLIQMLNEEQYQKKIKIALI